MKLSDAAPATAAEDEVLRKSRRLASLKGVDLLITGNKGGTLRLRMTKCKLPLGQAGLARQKRRTAGVRLFFKIISAYLIAEKSVPVRNSLSIFFTNLPSLVEAL